MNDRPAHAGVVVTERLRLEPITRDHAHDLWAIHNAEEVARWYQEWRPSPEEAAAWAETMADSWRTFGVHKWLAVDRETSEVVGRGGLSPTPADDDWGRVTRFLPEEAWTRKVRLGPHAEPVHAMWVENGWALLPAFWGCGYATEIGRAGLAYAFETLRMRAVVSCTAHDNDRSRAVMERIGMRHAGELADLDGGPDLAVYTLVR